MIRYLTKSHIYTVLEALDLLEIHCNNDFKSLNNECDDEDIIEHDKYMKQIKLIREKLTKKISYSKKGE